MKSEKFEATQYESDKIIIAFGNINIDPNKEM